MSKPVDLGNGWTRETILMTRRETAKSLEPFIGMKNTEETHKKIKASVVEGADRNIHRKAVVNSLFDILPLRCKFGWLVGQVSNGLKVPYFGGRLKLRIPFLHHLLMPWAYSFGNYTPMQVIEARKIVITSLSIRPTPSVESVVVVFSFDNTEESA